jgi:hypothetical protein
MEDSKNNSTRDIARRDSMGIVVVVTTILVFIGVFCMCSVQHRDVVPTQDRPGSDSDGGLKEDSRAPTGRDTASEVRDVQVAEALDIVDVPTESPTTPVPCDAAAPTPAEPSVMSFCAGTGIAASPDCNGACSPAPLIGDVAFTTLASSYTGSSPTCPDTDGIPMPGWLLKIEKVDVQPYAGDPTSRHLLTLVNALRMDVPAPCGVGIWIMLRDEKVDFTVGQAIRYATKRTVRNPETDVSSTTTIRDEQGHLMLAYVAGQRPEIWDADLLAEMSLALEEQILCRSSGFNVDELRVHLRTSNEDCALDCYAHRCCVLGGREFEVRADLAVHYGDKTGPASDEVNLLIRQSGLVSRVPPPVGR